MSRLDKEDSTEYFILSEANVWEIIILCVILGILLGKLW